MAYQYQHYLQQEREHINRDPAAIPWLQAMAEQCQQTDEARWHSSRIWDGTLSGKKPLTTGSGMEPGRVLLGSGPE